MKNVQRVPTRVYLVVHPQTDNQGAFAPLSAQGTRQALDLRAWLPAVRAQVVCASSLACRETAQATGLAPDMFERWAGAPDPTEKLNREHSYAVFGLPNNSVIIAGQQLLRLLGHPDPKLGAVYLVEYDGQPSVTTPLTGARDPKMPHVINVDTAWEPMKMRFITMYEPPLSG